MVVTMVNKICPISKHEPVFAHLIAGILTSGALLLPGSIVDCGAHWGGESCMYASLQPDRIVHAVEPLQTNLNQIHKHYGGSLPNLRPMLGALGSSNRMVPVTGNRDSKSMLVNVASRPRVSPTSGNTTAATMQIHALDSLFVDNNGAWAGEKLAFGHFDVEGSELDLLRGASMVLRRDRPVITVEIALRDVRYARDLLRELEALAYRVWLVPERCGIPADCRNLICVPVERNASQELVSVSTPVDSVSYDSTALRHVPLVNVQSLTGAASGSAELSRGKHGGTVGGTRRDAPRLRDIVCRESSQFCDAHIVA